MSFIVDKMLTGGIMVTYHCSAKCGHCRHNASPTREKRFISEEKLNQVLEKLSGIGCTAVHIEGGEPFLFPEELVRAVKQINDSNIALEHIVTNGSWYRNQKDTIKLLKKLQNNGLRRLILKVGPFQNEFIPLRKVQNLKLAAEKAGINVVLWDIELYPEVSAFEPTKKHSINQYIKKYGKDYILRCAQRFGVTFTGRSFDAYSDHLPQVSTNELLKNSLKCCIQNMAKHHFHVDLDGNFIFPNTNGVAMNIDDIGGPLPTNKYPFISILYSEGINGLVKVAKTEYNFKPRDTYISKCHLCHDTRAYLVNVKKVQSPELQPHDFYHN